MKRASLGQLPVLPGLPGGGLFPFPGIAPLPEVETPLPGNTPFGTQPSNILLTVLRADSMEPVAGAAVGVSFLPYDPARAVGDPIAVESGSTDEKGQYFFAYGLADPGALWEFTVTPGGSGVSFAEKTTRARTSMDLFLRTAVCPGGTDSLVCEIADKQAFFLDTYEMLNKAWNGPSAFTFGLAHSEMENFKLPKDARLKARWINQLSWGITDISIPPGDWAELLHNYETLMGVFNQIPFPELAGKDWFMRCARAIPLWRSRDGEPLSITNFKLYSPTWSDYFPREPRQIRLDLAMRYAVNFPTIGRCIEHKLRKKLREVERSQRAFAMMGLATAFLLGPMAGAAGTVNIIVEIGTWAASNWGFAGADFTDNVSDGLVEAGEPGLDLLIAAGLTMMVNRLTEDADPIVGMAAQEGVSFAVDAAFADVQNGVLAGGAANVTTLQGIGSAGAVAAVRFIVSAIKAGGAGGVKRVKEIIKSFQNFDEKLLPFALWIVDTLVLNALYDAAEAQLAEEEGEPSEETFQITVDGETGIVLLDGRPTAFLVDPVTGWVIDPSTRAIIDPRTGQPSGFFLDATTGTVVDSTGTRVEVDQVPVPRPGLAGQGLSTLSKVGGGALLAALAAAGIMTVTS